MNEKDYNQLRQVVLNGIEKSCKQSMLIPSRHYGKTLAEKVIKEFYERLNKDLSVSIDLGEQDYSAAYRFNQDGTIDVIPISEFYKPEPTE
jgi:hypothetical protein